MTSSQVPAHRRSARGASVGAAAIMVLSTIVAGPVAASPAAGLATGVGWVASRGPGPAGATLTSVQCPELEQCVAIGNYVTNVADVGIVDTDAGGRWASSGLPVPFNSASNPGTQFQSLSCPAVGFCVAVGLYVSSATGSFTDGLIETDAAGVWTATETPLPAAVPRGEGVELNDVSCPSAGYCVAVGTDSGGSFAATLSGGSWTAAQLPAPSGNAPGFGTIGDISCPAAGSCTALGGNPAIGSSVAESGGDTEYVETLKDGTWALTMLPLSARFTDNLQWSALDCPAAGFCAAAGSYESLSGQEGLLATETSGTWAVTEAPLPESFSSGSSQVVDLSCPATYACVAVGDVRTSLAGVPNGLIESQSGEGWTAAVAPHGNDTPLGLVSCARPGYCTALTGSAGDSELVEGESAGTWAYQGLFALPSGFADANPTSLTCPAAGECVAVGSVQPISNNRPDDPLVLTEESHLATSSVLPEAVPGQAFSGTLVATGGRPPYRWSVAPGTLPKGLRLDPSTGVISGVPAATALGFYMLEVTVTDSSTPRQKVTGTALLVIVLQLSVEAYPIAAVQGKGFDADVAHASYPLQGQGAAPASDLKAVIAWGDGASTPGMVRLVGRPVDGYANYEVVPDKAHTYTQADMTSDLTLRVTVVGKLGTVGTGTAIVKVYSPHPTGLFVVNPSNPDNDGLALLMPQEPIAGQNPVTEYHWTFSDDYHDVVDDAAMAPQYDKVLSQLGDNPGSTSWRRKAIKLGILPTDSLANVIHLGGLSAGTVTQIVRAWKAYFPDHIVPHYFDDGTGNVGLRLAVSYLTGTATAQSVTTKYVEIGRPGCSQWGGVLSAYFGGFTVCDSFAGVRSLFEPERNPDYIFLGASAGASDDAFGISAGVALVVTKGILSSPVDANSVYLELSFTGSVGGSAPETPVLGVGWVGPPDIYQSPPSAQHVDDYVNGLTVSAGFSFIEGLNAVLSPDGDRGYQAGVERNLAASIGGAVGVSCSTPLQLSPDIVAVAVPELREIFDQLSTKRSVRALKANIDQLLLTISTSSQDELDDELRILQTCSQV